MQHTIFENISLNPVVAQQKKKHRQVKIQLAMIQKVAHGALLSQRCFYRFFLKLLIINSSQKGENFQGIALMQVEQVESNGICAEVSTCISRAHRILASEIKRRHLSSSRRHPNTSLTWDTLLRQDKVSLTFQWNAFKHTLKAHVEGPIHFHLNSHWNLYTYFSLLLTEGYVYLLKISEILYYVTVGSFWLTSENISWAELRYTHARIGSA